jgi:hypothetical protein
MSNKTFHGFRWYAVFVMLFASAMFSSISKAQSGTATLTGQVVDSSKAAIVGATVTVRNVATNQTLVAQTNAQGEYTISNLQPAYYDIAITMSGFEQLHVTNLQLTVDQTARYDGVLKIGAQNESVSVTAGDTGLLNTETSSLGSVVAQIEVSTMPLNGRDFNDLAFTVAGVQPSEQKAKGAGYVSNGSRADSAGVYVDGINDESPRDAGSQISPPLDGIQEFKMETSGFTAKYGRLSGSVVNMVTKSGGNSYHASGFEYVRNDMLDASNYNFSGNPQAKSKLRQHQFGGNLSGPITIPHIYSGRDRSFFQLSLESERQSKGGSNYSTVPTLLERTGDFSQSGPGGTPYYFHNPLKAAGTSSVCTASGGANCLYPTSPSKIPTGSMDPVAQKLLAYYPNPNIPNAPQGQSNYFISTPSESNWNADLLRIDQKLTDKDQLAGRLIRRFSRSMSPTNGSALGTFGSHTTNHQELMGISETHIFSENLVNNFVYGLTRTRSAQMSNDAGTNFAQQLGVQGTTSDPSLVEFPTFNITGYAALGDSSSNPVTYVTNDFDGSDVATWIKKRHTFTIGGDIFYVQLFQPTNTSKNGQFTYKGGMTNNNGASANGLADLLAGYPTQSVLMTGGIVNHITQTNYSAFVQDDYKVTNRLTLNLGLRYEVQTLPIEENGQLSSYVPALGKIVYTNNSTLPNMAAMLAQTGMTNYFTSAQAAGLPDSLVHINPLRVAPRVGFAYRPFGDDRTVIRGGYGIFYTGIRLSVIRTNLTGVFPFTQTTTYSVSAPTSTKAGSLFINPSTPFTTAGSLPTPTPNGYDPNAPSANMQSYNLTIERDLGKGIGLEIAYAGSKGTHLSQETNINQERIANSQTSRPVPTFGTTNIGAITMQYNNGISHYDSVHAIIHKNFSHGFFFRANYTYAKSLDTQSGANAAGGGGYFGNQNTLNPRAEYGLSDFDIRQNFTVTGSYRTGSRFYALKDWSVSGNLLAYTGQPFTLKTNGKDDQGVAGRPDQLCNGTLSNPTISKWYNASCYSAQTVGQFGTAGRNILEGPGSVTLNLAAGRGFSVGEYGKFDFRLEGFNALNHPSWGYPSATIGTSTTPGVISSTNGSMRQVQLSGRYTF